MGSINTADVLLKYGADVNARNNDGYTPLDRAAKKDMKDLLQSKGGVASLGWWYAD